MSDDQFTRLFKYIEEFRHEVSERFVDVGNRFDQQANMIDGYAANMTNYSTEMAAMQHKIDRLEKYIQAVADKSGVDLNAVTF